MPVSSSTEHWIKPDALTINLNHFGDPDYLQVSVLAGAVVMAFKQDVIGYNAAHNYRTWPLEAANTYLETSSAYNVYARLTRSEVNARALIVYDTVLRDIEGREITYAEDGSERLGEPNPELYYVFLGQISESIGSNGQSKQRAWTIDFKTGSLDTSQYQNEEAGGEWRKMFRLNKVTDMIDVLKTFSSAIFKKLFIDKKAVTDVAVKAEVYEDEKVSDTILASTAWTNARIELIDDHYLRKDKDDRSVGTVSSDKGFEVGDFVEGLIGGSGAQLYKDERTNKTILEVDKIYGREELLVPKITYNCTDVVTGEMVQTFAFGEVKEVTTKDDGTGTISLELLEDEYGTLDVGDFCRGIFHFMEGNAMEYGEDKNKFPQYSGFSTAYFTPSEIMVNEAGRMEFAYSLQEGTITHPCKGMKFFAYGNPFDKKRQSIVYHTREYTRMLAGVTQWVIDPDKHIVKQDGNLDQLQIGGQKMEGYSSFQKNVYLTGSVIQFTPQQQIELKGEGAYSVSLSSYVGTLRFNDKGELEEERHTEQELEYYLRTTIQATRGTTELFFSETIAANAFSASINPVGCKATLVNGTIFVTSMIEGETYAYVEVDVSCEGYATYHLFYEIKTTKDGISPLTLVSSYTSITRNSLGAYEPSNVLIRCIRGKSKEKAHLAVFGTKKDGTIVRLSLDGYETHASSWDFDLESVSSYDFKSMAFRVYSNGLPGYPTVEEDYNTIPDAEVGVNFVSDGVEGPMPRNCGKFSLYRHYVYNHEFRDFVWNNSTSDAKVYIRKSRYATVGDEEGAIFGVDVTDTDYWEEVPRETLTAIDTALIDTANIAGFMFRNGKMVSQENDPLNEDANLILDGKNGVITAKKGVFKGDLYGKTISFDALGKDDNGFFLLPEIKGRYGMFYIDNAVVMSRSVVEKTYKASGEDRIIAITGASTASESKSFTIYNQETLILFSNKDEYGDYWAATKLPYWIFGREFHDSVANIQKVSSADEATETDVLYIITGNSYD